MRAVDWNKVSSVATTLALVPVLFGLGVAVWQLRTGARANEATTWLQYRELLMKYDDLHSALIKRRQLSDDEIERSLGYMGVLEHAEYMMKHGVVRDSVFEDLYGYRVELLVNNPQVMFWTLYGRGWPTFRGLVRRLKLQVQLDATLSSIESLSGANQPGEGSI
jgi:hypothetical protein